MPLYRLGNDGNWKKIVSMFRLGNDGIWKKIVAMYRLGNDGNWKKILSALADSPVATTIPTLRNATNVDPTTTVNDSLFFGGDTIYLTRGAYTNTTSNTDTKYTMTIYKSINYSSNIDNWTVVTGPTIYYGNNSNTNTSITYTVTDVDAKDGYYFAGRVAVNNDANIAGSTNTNFDVKNSNNLAKISFSLSSFIYANITSSGADFQWNVGGVPSTNFTTYFYNQKLEIKRASDNVVVHTVDNIAVPSSGTSFVTVSSANILENTTYYGVVTVTANDGWKTSNYSTTQISATSNFTTLAPRPVNIVAPAITPLNNRSYVPVNTQLTCSTGSWTNSPTSYSYSWEYDNGNNQLPPEDRWGQIPGSTNSNIYTPPSNYTSLYGNKIRCGVTASNNAGLGIGYSNQHFVDPEVTISAISPTSVNAGQSTNFAFTVSGYPTSYVIDWTNDGVTDYTSPAIASGTSSVNASVANIYSVGTSTLKVTAQPGNKQRTAIITAANQPTASSVTKSDGTITPSQPSAITFSSSNNQVTSTWTNGSPITSVSYSYSGAGTNGSLNDTTFPFVTSDLTSYSQSGTYTFTVTNFNNSLQVNVSWNQSNAASYMIDYSSSIFGAEQAFGNSSANSVSVDIPWNSNMGTFTLSGITVYSGANQTGLSTFYPNPSPGGVIPSQKSSSRSGSTSLTYQLLNLITNPAYGTATSTSGGWTASITTQPNPTGGTYSVISQTAGSASVNSSTGALTASGLNSGQSSTVTVRYSLSGYNPVDITASGSASVAQYTVTWNATDQGGTGGGSTTQNAGVAHTAPAASKNSFTVSYTSTGHDSGSPPATSQAVYGFRGYWDSTNPAAAAYGPIAVGGSFTPPYSITMYGVWQTTSNSITLPSPGMTRTGYTFGGWQIGIVTYSAGSSYTPTANTTATAVWNPNPPNDPVLLSGYPKQLGVNATSNMTIGATFDSTATSVLVEYGTSTLYGSSFSLTASGNTGVTSNYAIGTTIYYRLRSYNSTTQVYSNGITGSYTTVAKVTSVTASQSSTAPFVIWTVNTHGMKSMSTSVYKSTTSGGNTFATGGSDPIPSANTTTGSQTRQTSVTPGGVGYRYYLLINSCYTGNGGTGSAFDVSLTTNTFTHANGANTTVYTAP